MRHGPPGKMLALSVDVSVLEQRGHCWMGAPHLVVPFLGILAGVPELHVHPVLLRLTLQHRHRKRPNSYDSFVQGGYDDTIIDHGISKVGGCLIIDAKGVFDAIHRSESAALSMQDKRSAG